MVRAERVGVDTYLSRCRRGRARRVLRVGVSVCGRWGCWAVDWDVVGVWCTACGRVRRATWSPSRFPCLLPSVFLASAVRALRFSSSCRRPSSLRLLLVCRRPPLAPSAPACVSVSPLLPPPLLLRGLFHAQLRRYSHAYHVSFAPASRRTPSFVHIRHHFAHSQLCPYTAALCRAADRCICRPPRGRRKALTKIAQREPT